MAGVLPGVLLSLLFIATIYIVCRLHPDFGPIGAQFSFREKLVSLTGITDILILFVLVMGGLFIGFFTPTEAGAVGAGGALLLVLIKRQITWKGIITSFLDTARLSCMVMFILVGAAIFGHFISVSRVPFVLSSWVGASGCPPFLIAVIIATILVIIFPQIALFLPSLVH